MNSIFSAPNPNSSPVEDSAFTMYALEQEGVFDTRSRQEKIETVIEIFINNPEHCNENWFQEEVLMNEGLIDLTDEEIEYIISEVNAGMEDY